MTDHTTPIEDESILALRALCDATYKNQYRIAEELRIAHYVHDIAYSILAALDTYPHDATARARAVAPGYRQLELLLGEPDLPAAMRTLLMDIYVLGQAALDAAAKADATVPTP